MIKAIIFDMDGVLVDSPKYIWRSFNEVLKKDEIEMSFEEYKKDLGTPLKDRIERWKKDYGAKDYDVKEFSKKTGLLQLEYMKDKIKGNEKLNNLMKQFKEDGIKLAIATSSLKWRTNEILGLLGIKDYFEVIVSADDIKKGKPNPEVFLKTAKKLGISPGDCVVVEDAANGIQAAKSGGMKSIALLTDFHTREELKDADLIIESLDELNLDLIRGLIEK